MSDLIDRQAAIDAAKHAWAKGLEPSQYIEIIPSAQPDQTDCEYCHEDSDGYVKPLEKNCHAYIRFGMHGWVIELKAKGWNGKAPIRFCPICGRRLTDG